MIRLLKRLHYFYFLFIVLLFFVLFYPLYAIAARRTAWYGVLNRLRALNSLICSIFTGIFFRFTYEEQLDRRRHYIYCGNHSSNLDIMIFCLLAKGRFSFMGKDELLKNPVLKIFFNTIDIAVNRDSKISSFRAFKRAGAHLRQGRSLIIFPEGGISMSQYPPVMTAFKNGPFRLAIETATPIVPVSVTDAWKKLWDDGARYGSRPGICDIYVHKPIFTENMSADSADSLKDTIFDLINSKVLKK
ncbi:lysophospholipid acyltransferase family protein [Pedobacter hartonius]|uniref:1-acyl-sn-glycerol-3-phosphate acyltransferase n=1 Tax=Pedobacter hartonius TaxID=425514 RepID=A0A1H4D466_9SPHI|nr:lysophospholipid acyltransferase family protein [Pedobacter hartonius]SEA67290.1 1-acyl-sn-glycerol-3-phosphate acyltransferase [Pedobacter hartonius]